MAPTLYMLEASPAVRSVLMCAKSIELELNMIVVDLLTGEHMKPEFLKLNPQHTVPVLTDEDGFTVWDSHAILTYLVDKYGNGSSLYPAELKKRTIINQRLHFDSSILFNRGLTISRKIIVGGATKYEETDIKALEEAFELVEKLLEDRKFIAGDELTIADFSFVTSITSWSVFVPLDESKYPRICKWLKEMEKLPVYAECNQPGLEAYWSLLKSKLA